MSELNDQPTARSARSTTTALSGSTTAAIDQDRDRQFRLAIEGRRGRRLAISVLGVFVIIGVLGGFGYREATVIERAGRFEVVLEHPAVTRSGLPTRWAVTIRSRDGEELGRRVSVETTSAYFETFDHNDLVPVPDGMWQTAEWTGWEFEPSGEAELRITLDVRTQPDARWRRKAITQLRVDGELVSTLRYETMVLP